MTADRSEPERRTRDFTRNSTLETFLRQLNSELWASESRMLRRSNPEQPFPLILLVGPLRSGTTLFMQWLANTGLVAYPTNLISRFYGAPVLGAKIQCLLTDPKYKFRDELSDLAESVAYSSENGKTRGTLAPNEFWYFWRRFLEEPDRDVWTDDELASTMDTSTMKAELFGMMDVLQKPFAAKAMLFNYNIRFLDSLFDEVVFVRLSRDPVSTVDSILAARLRQLGNEAAWYSFRIPEYYRLARLEPVRQAAGQLYFIDQGVTQGLHTVADERKLELSYESFCRDPEAVFRLLSQRLGLADRRYSGPDQFAISDTTDTARRTEIEKALASFASA